jgi:hypothetical protein
MCTLREDWTDLTSLTLAAVPPAPWPLVDSIVQEPWEWQSFPNASAFFA